MPAERERELAVCMSILPAVPAYKGIDILSTVPHVPVHYSGSALHGSSRDVCDLISFQNGDSSMCLYAVKKTKNRIASRYLNSISWGTVYKY
jgi:hypothetical protein